MSEPIKKTDNQNNDWLDNLLSQTNFDSKIYDSVPLYQGELPGREISHKAILAELKTQATDQLLKLLKDKDQRIRESAAAGLSGNQDISVQRQLIDIAENKEAKFEHRLAALQALKGTTNLEIQLELASVIVTPSSAKIYRHNNQNTGGDPSSPGDSLNTDAAKMALPKIEQRQKLLFAAAEALGTINHSNILLILSSAQTGGFFKGISDTLKGISEVDKELTLHAALCSLSNSCGVLSPKVISSLIIDGLRSEQKSIRDSALKAALRNQNNLTTKVYNEVLALAKKIPCDEFTVEPTASLGEILSNARARPIRAGINKLLTSSNEAQRAIGIIATLKSQNIDQIKLVLSIFEQSKSHIEQGLAINTLGSCVAEDSPSSDIPKEALLRHILFSRELNSNNKALAIRALAGINKKSYLDFCLETMGDSNHYLSSAAMYALSKDRSPDITHKLLGTLELKEDNDRTIKSRAAEVLSKRLDPIATQHLRQTLEMGDDLECLYAMEALKGTNDILSLNYMLDIAGDSTRHYETRADALYAIDKSINKNNDSLEKSFVRKVSKLLEPIISNPLEDKMVRLSAINAVPSSAPLRLISELIVISKEEDPDLAPAALSKLANFDHNQVQNLFVDLYWNNFRFNHHDIALKNIGTNAQIEGIKILIRDISDLNSPTRASACQTFRQIFLRK
jgi:HEAT repeat protein